MVVNPFANSELEEAIRVARRLEDLQIDTEAFTQAFQELNHDSTQ